MIDNWEDMPDNWEDEEIFEDTETGLYGIGCDGGLSYDPMFTKEQAEFVLHQHQIGVKTFEQILKNAETAGVDMAVPT
jgi:hypothetical protein